MLGLVTTASLYRRGPLSVRLVRITRADGPARLLVHGPGEAHVTHVIDNAVDCLWYQTDIERTLVAEGYQLVTLQNADRRSGRDRRGAERGADRRRAPESLAS